MFRCQISFQSLLFGSGQVHVERRPGHMHVGMGAVHRQEGREVHVGLGEGWRERLRGPLEASDPRVVSALRDEHLRPPSSQPYRVDRYERRLNYKVGGAGVEARSQLGDYFELEIILQNHLFPVIDVRIKL